MNTKPAERRFAVLRHDVGPQLGRTGDSHLDWMLEVNGVLRTWTTPLIDRFDESIDLACEPISDHRIAYLTQEGNIGGGRGSVTRLLSGTYSVVALRTEKLDPESCDLKRFDPERFDAALRWTSEGRVHQARLAIYRSRPREEESRRAEILAGLRLRLSAG